MFALHPSYRGLLHRPCALPHLLGALAMRKAAHVVGGESALAPQFPEESACHCHNPLSLDAAEPRRDHPYYDLEPGADAQRPGGPSGDWTGGKRTRPISGNIYSMNSKGSHRVIVLANGAVFRLLFTMCPTGTTSHTCAPHWVGSRRCFVEYEPPWHRHLRLSE